LIESEMVMDSVGSLKWLWRLMLDQLLKKKYIY